MEPRRLGGRPSRRLARVPVLRLASFLVLACLAVAARGAGARVLLTRDAALRQAFGPRARIDTTTVYLLPDQVTRIEQAAGAKLASPRVVSYRGAVGDSLVGTAYLDTHPVRSQMETILIVINRDGKVGAVEVLAFNEPEDYLPPPRWLDRFEGKALSRDLKPGLAVPNLSGATLTARAVSAAVRRTLALHAFLNAPRGAR